MKLTIEVSPDVFARLADMATREDIRLDTWVKDRLFEIAYRSMSKVEFRLAAEEKIRELHGKGLNDSQIAEQTTYSASGVRAVRHRLGLGLHPTVIKHGTKGAYNAHGCRCDACRQANTDYYRMYRDRRKAG